MESLIGFLKNYKKHPILATLLIVALIGAGIFLYVQSQKDSTPDTGDSSLTVVTKAPTEAPGDPTLTPGAQNTVTPTEAPTPTNTAAATPTDTVKPTAAPTPTNTVKPTKAPTPTNTVKPTKAPTPTSNVKPTPTPKQSAGIDEDGWYYDKESVALYIHTYGHLPGNYITKKEAEALGWSGGSVDRYAKGKAIGGDYFGNYEGLLPKKNGRKYTECDIDTKGKSRGAKRIIFSNDGLIFYTDDHYETFTQLY